LGRDRALDVDADGCGGRSGGSAGAGAVCLVVVVGNAELSRVCVLLALCCAALISFLHTLVLSGAIYNQFNTVVCLVRCEVGVRGPFIAASVVDAFDNGLDRLDIGGRPVKKDERDFALGVGFPGDCERLADGDDAVKTGLVDGITSRVTLGSSVG
jgi:hypothetical protein